MSIPLFPVPQGTGKEISNASFNKERHVLVPSCVIPQPSCNISSGKPDLSRPRPPVNTENGLHHQHNGQQRNFLQNHFPLCAGRGYFPEMYAPLKPVSTLLSIIPANGTRRKGRSLSITNSGKTTFTIGNKETLSIHSK